ncbi:hypothetical protein IEQ34_014827 [Dendrobium chrysotoxum]|uniref:Uncharacterized protein n=1 Tax=Dendrobium chrysotoxum TaxID=161865 RepID=A0AAV7GMU4_DENCH|nr:hypothetical protein IEQ34_014827 [Dendrobium chrysotoxum]
MKVPARSDRACFPPLGYVTVYEFSLRAGLRFPPASELIDILTICGVCLSQFSYRVMSIVMGLIMLFRDREVEKWKKLKELPVPLHIGAKDLLRILKLPNLDALHYELVQHSDFKLEITKTLNDWNNKFVKVKYLQGEYKRKYDSKVKEMKLPFTVIEEFKKSYAFKIIIEDHIQEARNHIYDVEVKAFEVECIEDGFIRGFLKGVRVVHHKTGAKIEGLTPSQASGDASSDSSGEELERELQQAFALEEDEDDIKIM